MVKSFWMDRKLIACIVSVLFFAFGCSEEPVCDERISEKSLGSSGSMVVRYIETSQGYPRISSIFVEIETRNDLSATHNSLSQEMNSKEETLSLKQLFPDRTINLRIKGNLTTGGCELSVPSGDRVASIYVRPIELYPKGKNTPFTLRMPGDKVSADLLHGAKATVTLVGCVPDVLSIQEGFADVTPFRFEKVIYLIQFEVRGSN